MTQYTQYSLRGQFLNNLVFHQFDDFRIGVTFIFKKPKNIMTPHISFCLWLLIQHTSTVIHTSPKRRESIKLLGCQLYQPIRIFLISSKIMKSNLPSDETGQNLKYFLTCLCACNYYFNKFIQLVQLVGIESLLRNW